MKWELVSHSPSSISCTSSFPTPLYLFPSPHLSLPLSLPHLAPFWIILSSCFLNPPSCSVCLPSSPLVSPLILPHVIRKLKRSFSPCPRVSLSLSLSLAFTFHFHPSLSQIVSRSLFIKKKLLGLLRSTQPVNPEPRPYLLAAHHGHKLWGKSRH